MSVPSRAPARRFGFGLGLHRLWQKPRDFYKNARRYGFVPLMAAHRGEARMRAAAWHLHPAPQPSGEPYEIHFLTGGKFWYQSVFCALSMARHSPVPIRPVLYDDGSLAAADINAFRRVFPTTRIYTRPELEDRLDQYLPKSRYPSLRAQRLPYPHLRKITDVHAGQSGWKLVLDSDMLFLAEPRFLLDWLAAPTMPVQMRDVIPAYGYSASLMEQVARGPIPQQNNVGVCGLNSSTLDWDWLEHACRTLVDTEGLQYFLEQALGVLLVTGGPYAVCPPADYIVKPNERQVRERLGILQHYTADSKLAYFRYGWQSFSL